MLQTFHCVYCASAQQVVEVHGHIQCIRCGINIDPCCSGSSTTHPTYEDDAKFKDAIKEVSS